LQSQTQAGSLPPTKLNTLEVQLSMRVIENPRTRIIHPEEVADSPVGQPHPALLTATIVLPFLLAILAVYLQNH
jgi:hypothetical protein